MKNLLTFLIHDYDLVMYMYIIIDMTLIPDFDNGLYRAHTFYDKVSRHEWIFMFAAIKHLNVHIKVKQLYTNIRNTPTPEHNNM